MQFKKLLQSLVIVIPVMTLAACSSTKDAEAEAEAAAAEAAAAEAAAAAALAEQQRQQELLEAESIVTEGVEPMLTTEEIREQELEQLQKEHIIYFDFDRSDVRGEFGDMLATHADFLIENADVNVLIEGHGDERGTPEYNIALGERRAKAVEKYLRSLGVPSSQISVVSYGEEKPMDYARTDEAFAKNRRAVLVY